MKSAKPFWRNLTEKEKTNHLRRAFFHTVGRMKKSVAAQELEEIEKFDFMKTARRRFSRSLHARVNIPKTAKLYLEGKVVTKNPSWKRVRDLKLLRRRCTVEVTLQKVGCRVKSSAVKNPKSKLIVDMGKHKFTYGFIVERRCKKRIFARYTSEAIIKLVGK